MSKQVRHMIIAIVIALSLAVLTTGCPGRAGTTASTMTQAVTTSTATASTATASSTTASTAYPTTSLVPTKKPAIYLYPQATLPVHITLNYDGRLTCTYPHYPEDGWRVIAYPDGRLVSQTDGREYSYLYWEGLTEAKYDFSKGFVVAGKDTAAFLQEKLAFIGLTPREYNEFIVFWLPQMQDNPYNLITFQGKAYTDQAILSIEPNPDSLLRVFMAYQPLQEHLEIEEQELTRFERTGFAVVEWGGTCVK